MRLKNAREKKQNLYSWYLVLAHEKQEKKNISLLLLRNNKKKRQTKKCIEIRTRIYCFHR